MNKLIVAIAGILVIAALGGWLVFRGPEAPRPQPLELRRAPEFILRDYEGREVRMADFRGKVVLINSWAAWCPFCKEELKDFAAVKKEFGDRVAIIAVDRAEPLETAKKFSDELDVTNELVFLLDPDDSFYQSIGGFSMPETIFVDREGLIRHHKRGPMEKEEIRRRIEDLLNN